MSLVFAGICPHPPVIIPEVGKHDTNIAYQTVNAMKKLAHIFNEAEVDTLIIISPHSLIYPDRFNICAVERLFGTFGEFGAPEVMVESKTDIDLVNEIDQLAQKSEIKTLLYDNGSEFFELDHGSMVPLYYLKHYGESSFKVVNIAYSNLDKAKHFAFGQVLKEAAENSLERVGILASGDLSHRLMTGSDEDIKTAKEFDEALVNDLKEGKTEDIMYYDEDVVEKAGECGFRSIVTLLGALDQKEIKPEILSYEGPFGVGYLVANFKINKEEDNG